jgi:hypothetical protein
VFAGCKTKPVKPIEVVEKPEICYPIPFKPKIQKVHFKVQKLETGQFITTLDDENFNKLLLNNVRVDTYINQSFNTLIKYKERCQDKNEVDKDKG